MGHPLQSVAEPDLLNRLRHRPAGREAVEAALGHRFARPSLLDEALTHASSVGPAVAGRRHRRRSYDRLEFLGDRVLGMVVAHLLFEQFPNDAEGALTQRQVALVRRETLAEVAGKLGVGSWVDVAPSEETSGGRANPALLADALEALIGALFLDGGYPVAHGFIETHFRPLLAGVAEPPRDAKMVLQEWAQGRGHPLPVYRLVGTEGPAHAARFTAEVTVADQPAARGEGASKRAAERAAAEQMLRRVREKDS
ncbi:MAG: ribonuclease III [Geminicoccaceae bacterium]